MAILENFEPKNVFHYFEEICGIPHGSGNTKQISDYLVNFAKEHDLKYVQDDMNNVVIYKPATPGYENAPTVILQGHMDMVCAKCPEIEHDFTKDGLKLVVKDGFLSESRLIILLPFKRLQSNPSAPRSPVSSSTVKTTSKVGCGKSVLSKSARP